MRNEQDERTRWLMQTGRGGAIALLYTGCVKSAGQVRVCACASSRLSLFEKDENYATQIRMANVDINTIFMVLTMEEGARCGYATDDSLTSIHRTSSRRLFQ